MYVHGSERKYTELYEFPPMPMGAISIILNWKYSYRSHLPAVYL